MKWFYLGPEGTHSHEAAAQLQAVCGMAGELVPCSSIPAAVEQVFRDEAVDTFACVPIENSIQGAVTQTWDVLMKSMVETKSKPEAPKMLIALTLPIHHYAIYRDGTEFSRVKHVYSHQQALAQCQNHIAQLCPNAALVAVNSTAEAARMVSEHDHADAVAIGSRRAADRYGLSYIPEPAEDKAGNVTRFALVGKRAIVVGGKSGLQENEFVASLCLRGVGHQPGGLVGALQPFADFGMNLARVESRPVGDQLGNYVFYVDVSLQPDHVRAEQLLVEVIAQLTSQGIDVVVLGAYPVCHGA
ncbi:prephenate dehydratase [Alicyclobacillus dauci]|uniref:Prephenate dehydratase n=1 Tax=Alicyclobacillus dauci TaxID=1475485 RepID=A0ABY6YXU1_9BACL|nr:prephenate dehydratase [Alicyclobacillus dauci]WAH35372.1 prephenate dehydratase [Alicyclobacillus dauci]